MWELVVFDVDGVLLDSLGPHLAICRDKAREYALDLEVPTEARFREMIREGVKISPMEDMFVAAGFPRPEAQRADSEYKREFMEKYRPEPYEGVEEMLAGLARGGVRMAIVTANVRENVDAALGDAMAAFDRELIYTKDDFGGSKAEALGEILQKTGVAAKRSLYIGDQPADQQAAEAVGMPFLGAAYGWGIDPQDDRIAVVGSVEEIVGFVLA